MDTVEQTNIIDYTDRKHMLGMSGKRVVLIINEVEVSGRIVVTPKHAIRFYHSNRKLYDHFRKESSLDNSTEHKFYTQLFWSQVKTHGSGKIIPFVIASIEQDKQPEIEEAINPVEAFEDLTVDVTDRTQFDYMVHKTQGMIQWAQSRCEEIEREMEENTNEYMIAKERLHTRWVTKNDDLLCEYNRLQEALKLNE